MKNPPTLADQCIASALDKRSYGNPKGDGNAISREVLLDVAKARKFVLDGPMSRFLAELGHDFWRGGLRKRTCLLENARQQARAPHALTWIEFSYHADYLQRIIELKGQGVADRSGRNPLRMGWLIRQHPRNDAAFIAYEIRSQITNPERVFMHQLAAAWCTDDEPSPWRRFPPREVWEMFADETSEGFPSEAVAGMPGYQSTQAHWHAYLGDALTIQMMNDTVRHFAGKDSDQQAATRPAVAARVLWALLATINDLPVTIEHVEPSRGYIMRGSYRKFVTHSIVHLTVPETRWRKLLTTTASLLRRRAHQVRGHWRNDWRKPLSKACDHEFNADLICRRCGGHKIWIAEHQRGDASIGFVTHDYSVEHEPIE